MKQPFDFTVTGRQLLPAWLLIYVCVLIPRGVDSYMTSKHQTMGLTPGQDLLYFFVLMIVTYLVYYFFIKKALEGVRYKEHNVEVNVDFSSYFFTIATGVLLSIVTLFIYTPWFIRNVTELFCDNSSLDSEEFSFLGKGGKLFWILFLTLFLPIVVMVIMFVSAYSNGKVEPDNKILFYIVALIVTIPYMYFLYKWFVDVNFKAYHIEWETELWPSLGVIAREALLTVVTVGIYLPMAYLHLYEYFSARTVARSEETTLRFGFNYDPTPDFLFIWGQTLLVLVTLGIYYPWAFARVAKRFLTQTTLDAVED